MYVYTRRWMYFLCLISFGFDIIMLTFDPVTFCFAALVEHAHCESNQYIYIRIYNFSDNHMLQRQGHFQKTLKVGRICHIQYTSI